MKCPYLVMIFLGSCLDICCCHRPFWGDDQLDQARRYRGKRKIVFNVQNAANSAKADRPGSIIPDTRRELRQ